MNAKPVLALTVLLALGGINIRSAAAREIPNIQFDEAHDPFYQEPFHALQGRVQAAVPNAYERIAREWGLDPSRGLSHSLVVQIKEAPDVEKGSDSGSDPFSGSERLQRRPAYTELIGRGDALRQFLVVDIGAYMQHPTENVEQIVAHEMAHAILNDAAGGAPIPRWFNEGLAQSVTPEGRQAVRKAFTYWKASDGQLTDAGLCDLDAPVDEFAHGPDNAYCYPEYYLAVQRLKQLGGRDAVPRVLRGLRRGKAMDEMIPSITGMESGAFQKEVERYAAQIFDGRRPVP